MDFWIQASDPRGSGDHDAEDESLGEAVETAFPLHAESALLVWNHLYIALSYKYDVSVIITDLIALLELLMRPGAGSHEVQWASNTFCARWVLQWDSAGELMIDAEWTSVVGVPSEALKKTEGIRIPKSQFIAEWKQLLGRVLTALTDSGYDETSVSGMKELERLTDEIPQLGVLYA